MTILDIYKPIRKISYPLNSAYLIFDQKGKKIWRSFAIPLNGRKAVKIIKEALQS